MDKAHFALWEAARAPSVDLCAYVYGTDWWDLGNQWHGPGDRVLTQTAQLPGQTVGLPRVAGWTPAVVLHPTSPHGKRGGTGLGNSLICVRLQLPPPLLGQN